MIHNSLKQLNTCSHLPWGQTPKLLSPEGLHQSFPIVNHSSLTYTYTTPQCSARASAIHSDTLTLREKAPRVSITLISGALQWQLWFTNTPTRRWWTGSLFLAYPLRPPVCSLKWLCYNTQGLPWQWWSVRGWSVLFMLVLL